MYIEYAVIDGILHERHDPKGEFKPMSAEQITVDREMMRRNYESTLAQQRAEIARLREVLTLIANINSEMNYSSFDCPSIARTALKVGGDE